jgi:thiamine pyrophosphate-dependent acetolactate synthase large subunit-like protein
MLLGDLATIATYDLPVQVIVFDNGLLDMGHWEMLAEGYEPFQTDLKNLTSPSSPTRTRSSGSASAATVTCPERAAPEIARSGGLRTGAEIHAKPAEAR